MNVPKAVGALVLVALLGAGCGGGRPKTAASTATGASTTTTSPATTAQAEESTTTGGGPTTTTAATGTGGSSTGGGGGGGAPTTVPATGGPSAAASLTFADAWARREGLVGTQVEVKGRVVFTMSCPPPGGGGPTPCIATAALTDDGTTDLPTYEQLPAFPLVEAGVIVGCSTPTLANFTCKGWEDQHLYAVVATVAHQVAGGRPTSTLVLEVAAKHVR